MAFSVDRFFTRLNPLIVGILRSPLHGLLSWGLAVITVTGHKTGRRYSFPVGYQREAYDRVVVMVSEAPRKTWWKNYRHAGPVELRIRGRDRRGHAEVVDPHSDDFRNLVEQTVRRVRGMDRVFKFEYDRERGLTEEQAAHVAHEVAAVRIVVDSVV